MRRQTCHDESVDNSATVLNSARLYHFNQLLILIDCKSQSNRDGVRHGMHPTTNSAHIAFLDKPINNSSLRIVNTGVKNAQLHES